MFRFPISFPSVEFDLGPFRVPVYRPRIEASLLGIDLSPYVLIDSGAPFSVIGEGVARLFRTHHANKFTILDIPEPISRFERENHSFVSSDELRTWNGHPCDFGETTVRLIQQTHSTGPLLLRAKFVRTPSMFFGNNFILLGMSFLADNEGSLHIDATGYGANGYLSVR